MATEATDGVPWLAGVAPKRRTQMVKRSTFVPMRDGVRLAVDVHLPADRAGERLPTILRQTRYYRGIAFKEPFARLGIEWLLDHAAKTRDRFVAAGFAWVDVCVRGSGASFGHRPCPWSPDETADGRDLVDWIVAQPWSSGRVGATGVSYDGTTAEMLLVNGHPAVRAAAPRFSLFDTYADVAFPGGIHLAWFTELWSAFNRELDAGALDAAYARMVGLQLDALADLRSAHPEAALFRRLAGPGLGPFWRAMLRVIARGVRPVEPRVLAEAYAAHQQNFNVHTGALGITFRDDAGVSDELEDATIDLFSPHTYRRAIEASGVPILSLSGWLDGAYQHSAVKRFRTIKTAGSGLVIGPWDHGGMHHVSPRCRAHQAAFDQDAALVRFFGHHLRGDDNGVNDDLPVRYFTIGSERWSASDTWPPPDATPRHWHLGGGALLSPDAASAEQGADVYRVDRSLGTGRRSRWASLLGLLVPVGYGRRAEAGSRMLVYRSAPLEASLTVAGHPIVVLHLAADRDDAHVFLYLEDEHPGGHVDYVTEGQLRLLHRKTSADAPYDTVAPYRSFTRADSAPLEPGQVSELVIDLLPIAWRFERGHRVRLALAGADADHFVGLAAAPTLTVHRGGPWPSRLELPIVVR